MTRAEGLQLLIRLLFYSGCVAYALFLLHHLYWGYVRWRKAYEFWNDDMKQAVYLLILLVIALSVQWVLSLPEALPAQ